MDADRRTKVAGILLGMGFGGFVDGIVLHQLLQAHHMVSSLEPTTTVRGLELNTLADGVFHATTWLVSFAGVLLLWRAGREGGIGWRLRPFLGLLLLGWGVFNLLDTVNHVAGLHHVYEAAGEPWRWDLGFFVLALLQVGAGRALARGARGGEAVSTGVHS